MHQQNELSQVYDAKEVVDQAVRGQRRDDGLTQKDAVWSVLNTFEGEDIPLDLLREFASETYGRTITLGITLRLKHEWLADQGRRAAA